MDCFSFKNNTLLFSEWLTDGDKLIKCVSGESCKSTNVKRRVSNLELHLFTFHQVWKQCYQNTIGSILCIEPPDWFDAIKSILFYGSYETNDIKRSEKIKHNRKQTSIKVFRWNLTLFDFYELISLFDFLPRRNKS